MSSPLQGRRIVNTRALHQAGEFDDLIWKWGAVPVSYPCIKIVPPADTTELDKAVYDLVDGEFDWLILTSVNTVLILADRLRALGLSLNKSSFKTAVIGSSTAETAVKQLGLTPDVLPDEYIGEALAEALHVSTGTRVLLPASAIARPAVADLLKRKGASVKLVATYDTVTGSGGVALAALLRHREIDVIVFTSSSTVINFIKRIKQEAVPLSELNSVCITCIGSKTEATAHELGLNISVVAQPYTLVGVLDSLETYFEELTGVSDGYTG